MKITQVRSVYFNYKDKGLLEKRYVITDRTLTEYIIPRTLVSEAKKDFQESTLYSSGIYYLIEEDEDSPLQKIYVGQTTNGIKRMDDHLKKKDYWGKVIMFLFDHKDNEINLDALERHAISEVIKLKKYDVQNQQKAENNINSDMTNLVEEYYKKIKFLMISSGYSLETNQGSSSIFKTNRRGIVARGIYSGDSFEVLEGSEVDILNQSKLEKYNQMREELIKDEILIKEGDKYILKKSLEFKTPSGASDFVLGGATNGWTEWKNNENKTLDEVYRKINN